VTGCPVQPEFDPLGGPYLRDPYAVLAEVGEAPVFYAPSLDYYVVTRYADIERVFLDPETYSAANAQLPLVPLAPEVGKTLLDGGHRPQPSMVSLDPPAHGRLRKPAARAFTPRRVDEMAPRIRATAVELLDAVDASGPFDLIAALAFPLPMRIMFSFMGVPEADWPRLKEWCGSRASLAWGRPGPEEALHHARQMVLYRRYLRELVTAKAGDRGGDFCSALLEIHDEDPDALAHEDIASILFSLSFAGHETTNNLIGNCVRRLLEVPERWARLVAEPELIAGAVDEILRFDPSVPVWRRVTTKPVTLGGADLPLGAMLYVGGAAAGRDAAVFPEPDAFDPERANSRRTLAFGRGIHFCIGSALGRLEATLALAELTRRFPRLRLLEQDIPFHPNISFRGPQALWVEA
jgi:cytochrome P450